jgi:hypothetical protein
VRFPAAVGDRLRSAALRRGRHVPVAAIATELLEEALDRDEEVAL